VTVGDIHAKLSGSEESYRYLEERIYPGDHVFVLGQFFRTPLDEGAAKLDEGDDEDQAGPHGWPGFNPKRFREAMREAAGVTKLRITEPQDKRWPLVVSGIPITAAMGVYNRRAKGCFIPAVVVAIFLLCLAWVHFIH
jgi:hypothetical protein